MRLLSYSKIALAAAFVAPMLTFATTMAELKQDITDKVDARFQQLQVPGVSISVVLNEVDSFSVTQGVANVNTQADVTDEHLFRLASMSKHFTAILILKLQEQGFLNIDDPVNNYMNLPSLPNQEKITIRQLLNHSAGVYDHINNPNDIFSRALAEPNKVWTQDEILQYAIDAGSDFEPGTSYGYSNMGFYILGLLVEEVMQDSFANVFAEKVAEPLGLENVFVDDFSDTNTPIAMLAENNRAYEYHKSLIGAAGNFVATPSDISKILYNVHALDFLTPESVDMLITGSENNSAYGLGTRLWGLDGIYHYGHTGTLGGYKNITMYLHEQDAAITFSINGYTAVSDDWWGMVYEVFDTVVAYKDPDSSETETETETETESGSETDTEVEPTPPLGLSQSGSLWYGLMLLSMLCLRKVKAKQ